MLSIPELLGSDGPLAQHIAGFAPRTQQQEMAEAVRQTLADNGLLMAEAGTGTGKTYAYLVPALLSGKKVLISTGTKNLQDQLFHRDLPTVAKALGVSVPLALLKGRANYLCHHRLQLTESEGRLVPAQQDQLARIRSWLARTDSGDINELSEVPEGAPIWPRVTSTTDNCLGSECPVFSDCFVVKARKAAQAAEVLVVNHHLFFADMALRDEGFGEVLPGVNAFIFDEAHQLPEVASNFFGLNLSGRQLLDLGRDTLVEAHAEAPDVKQAADLAAALERAVQDFRLALGVDVRRAPWALVQNETALATALASLRRALADLEALLEALAERGKGLERCWRRCLELQARLGEFEDGVEQAQIQWFETHSRGFVLHLTPLDISDTFRAYVDGQKSAWVFTSATLAVGDSFQHFARSLGVEDARSRRWDSPFDFAQQALLYVPTAMPEPNSRGYTEAVVAAARPVLAASGGRAFLLMTSHRALRQAAELLRDSLDYPLLVQGDLPRDELLSRFRRLGNAVLIGTSSFWEGVDVRGEALSCVIIDKLPFAAPDDPVLQARLAAMRAGGLNPFMDYQLPQAVITLKQGVGRLIRDVHDRGVLMICDPRLYSKPYGRVFRASLPPMPISREAAAVTRFFEEVYA
jgi:ATP-dependent DNA helicase DinG